MQKMPVARTKDLVIQNIGRETLVYDLLSNEAFCLNATSALVWKLCDGNRSDAEVSDEMSKRLKTPVGEDFVRLALEQLLKEDLLETDSYKTWALSKTSRRAMIRKLGLTAVVTLPIVLSLVAPKASFAQSCFSLNSSCSGGGSCCTGLFCVPVLAVGTRCCANSTTQGNSPGVAVGCDDALTGTCNLVGPLACCSGTAVLGTVQGACLPTEYECICA